MKTKNIILTSLFLLSFLTAQFYQVELEPTGASQLIVFSETISGLNPGDEIGIFDAAGILNWGDCTDQIGELLVGAAVWTGEQINATAVGSIDYCDFGGTQYAGWVEGDPILLRIYKPDLMIEYETEATFSLSNGLFGDLLIVISELTAPQQYYNPDLNPTGEYQLIIFMDTISGLNPDDEIGIFDAAGILNSGDCSNQIGELLVGAIVWTGDQISASAIGSIDYCDIGGNQFTGWVDGNPIIIRVYKPDLEMEFEPEVTYLQGSGEFGQTLISISALAIPAIGCTDDTACNYDFEAEFDDGSCEYIIDCNDECGGSAHLDNCDICDDDPLNDNLCFFDGPQNLIAISGENEITLNWESPNWDHSRNSATLFITEVTSEYIEISMINDENVYGVQFAVQSSGLQPLFLSASGGLGEGFGFEFQFNESGVFIGFSGDGNYIPPGNGVLTYIFWENSDSDEWIYLSDLIVSGYDGVGIEELHGPPFCYGECELPLDFNIYRDGEFLDYVFGITEYTDIGLPDGITHCYTVSWVFENYESDLSSEACTSTFTFDCAGVQNGSAYFDECGDCCGGTTGVECSYWNSETDFDGLMDCNAECSGSAWINECGCVEGSTGNDIDFCYGCTDPTANNFDPDAIIDCNGDNSCCEYPVDLSFGNADYQNSTIELFIDSPIDIFGFSITLFGASLESADQGLAEQFGFNISISGNTVNGESALEEIPAQSGVLTVLTVNNPGYAYFFIT
ncbi:MAG: hypothetical protein HQ510_10205 [Candidatus Marinimicrobia bacterium]|nr:hypothetical protein [Candidatus Neomarinimicrobiota bacterium]